MSFLIYKKRVVYVDDNNIIGAQVQGISEYDAYGRHVRSAEQITGVVIQSAPSNKWCDWGINGFLTTIFMLIGACLDIWMIYTYNNYGVERYTVMVVFCVVASFFFTLVHLMAWALCFREYFKTDKNEMQFNGEDTYKVPLWFAACPILATIYCRCHDHTSVMSAVNDAFLSFPLYIVNVAYVLFCYDDYNQIPVRAYLSIAWHAFALIVLNANTIRELSNLIAGESIINKHSSCGDKFRYYLITYPLLIIEIIHFLPVFIAYCHDHTITGMDVVYCMIMFFVLKPILCCHGCFKSTFLTHKLLLHTAKCLYIFILYPLSYLLLPLIVYTIQLFQHKANHNAQQLQLSLMLMSYHKSQIRYRIFLISMYSIITYGGVNIFLFATIGWEDMSTVLRAFILIVFALVIWIPVAFISFFPKLGHREYQPVAMESSNAYDTESYL